MGDLSMLSPAEALKRYDSIIAAASQLLRTKAGAKALAESCVAAALELLPLGPAPSDYVERAYRVSRFAVALALVRLDELPAEEQPGSLDEEYARELAAFTAVPLGVPYAAAAVGLADAYRSSKLPVKRPPLIWWTNESDCTAIEVIGWGMMGLGYTESDGLPFWPEYLRDQYQSRYGRNGRGRLWVADQFGEIDLSAKMSNRLGKYLAEATRGSYAGIVIATQDVRYLTGLPGVITDLDLRPIYVGTPPWQ